MLLPKLLHLLKSLLMLGELVLSRVHVREEVAPPALALLLTAVISSGGGEGKGGGGPTGGAATAGLCVGDAAAAVPAQV